MPVSVTETFISAPQDLLPALADALQELGLELHEGFVGEGPEQERGLCYAHGWLRLADPWGLEAPLLQRLARALGQPVEHVRLRASASLGAPSASYTLECSSARVVHPDGSQAELRAAILRHPFTFDDTGAEGHRELEDLRDALDEFLNETAWDTLTEIRRLEQETRYFILRRPEGWEPPARFTLAMEGSGAEALAQATLQAGDTRHVLPTEAVSWLAFTLQEAGMLDRSQPEPDLSRWTPRLLRRLGMEDEPAADDPRRAEWEAAWARLTLRERSAVVSGGRRLPAWKLEQPGTWELTAPEVARLKEVAARSHPREHLGHAEAWLRALRGAQAATLCLE